MKFNVEKLKQIARPMNDTERSQMEFRQENRDWLRLSAMFALKLRRIMEIDGITQSELASRMGVSPAQVTKILSGKENLQLKTIAKVNAAIGRDVVDFSIDERITVKNDVDRTCILTAINSFTPACGKPYRRMYFNGSSFLNIDMVSNLC